MTMTGNNMDRGYDTDTQEVGNYIILWMFRNVTIVLEELPDIELDKLTLTRLHINE